MPTYNIQSSFEFIWTQYYLMSLRKENPVMLAVLVVPYHLQMYTKIVCRKLCQNWFLSWKNWVLPNEMNKKKCHHVFCQQFELKLWGDMGLFYHYWNVHRWWSCIYIYLSCPACYVKICYSHIFKMSYVK